ncbi:MAG TPA: hypothetical protein VLD67_01945 [Vicinamibacterales bacterium]|nr:hypothetical protein [Vicinamibacterales bacterium]
MAATPVEQRPQMRPGDLEAPPVGLGHAFAEALPEVPGEQLEGERRVARRLLGADAIVEELPTDFGDQHGAAVRAPPVGAGQLRRQAAEDEQRRGLGDTMIVGRREARGVAGQPTAVRSKRGEVVAAALGIDRMRLQQRQLQHDGDHP